MSRLATLLATLLLLGSGVGTASAARAWAWPLSPAPVVTRPFGLGPTVYAAGHRGADLAGEPGQPVLTAGAGRVTYAGLLAGRGVVTVTHGALRTTYEPVTATVRVGATVAFGEQVGTLEPGHEGCPVAACLHWGLRRGDTYLDPLRLVRQGPVRLLTPGDVAGARVEGAGGFVVAQARTDRAHGRSPSSAPAASAAPTSDHDQGPTGASSATGRVRPDRRLAAGLTAGAALLLLARSGAAVRRSGVGGRSSGVGR